MLSIVPIKDLVALQLTVRAIEVSEYRQFKKKYPVDPQKSQILGQLILAAIVTFMCLGVDLYTNWMT